ncbi:pectin esterase [Hymenobacter taeanensis]|uniref:Pectinesterase n=1 Tax=Hymenobacter taeanensis TaxID=2735321 RepID=A0A6M6BHF2_9BACT|nr:MULTISPECIES: pectinesterase family protein [Hymenobacter]QJX47617.1 pectin esterase [Hymenobacter taeanensis]UOQ82900.1 pectinesterase family protein [Hymenobacter sp. 5414T-23]
MPRILLSLVLSLLLLLTLPGYAQVAAAGAPILVAQDGSGQFKTLQEAVNAVPNQSQQQVIIRVKPGVYKEKLVVPALKTHISLLGDNAATTIITFDDHTGKGDINTYTSHSVLIQGNDFRAENITFQNTAGRGAGQAVALHVEADRCVFRNCRILGDQDTLFLASNHTRQYFHDCYIEGTTDFIFGAATAVFDRCNIYSKKNSHITAASTPQEQAYGFVFLNCRLLADTSQANNVSLGRPWRPYAKVAYLNTYMGSHIRPAGWDNWKKPENEKTASYVEYRSSGPGATVGQRVSWSRQLTAKEAKQYTIKHIFASQQPWSPEKK